jgi:signal transduction histidine kinase/streptogramin lyase
MRVTEQSISTVSTDLPTGVRPLCGVEDRAGAFWIGTMSHGLFRFDGTTMESVETSHEQVGSLLEDREGNIWAGTFGGGLNRIQPRAIELIGTESGLPSDSVISVCEDEDGIHWSVTESGQLVRGEERSWSIVPAGEFWQGGTAMCVAADHRGTLWIGTGGQGLHQVLLRGKTSRVWRRNEGLPSNSIRALLVASDGSLWFSTNAPPRLCHLSDGVVTTLSVPSTVRNIRTIVQSTDGTIWIGTSDGQVLKVSGGLVVSDPALASAPVTSIRTLHATPDGSLWIGYAEGGMGHLKQGRYARFSATEGLIENSISQIASDRTGALWLASSREFYRIPIDEALDVAEGRKAKIHPVPYGRPEGLPHPQPHYDHAPGTSLGRDGRLLFSTSLGLLAVNPESLRGNPIPPPVVLERVLVDEQVAALRDTRFPLRDAASADAIDLRTAHPVLRLPPGHRRLSFEFAALSYTDPDLVRFRFRLDGIDDSWTEPGAERSARYSRLPAGTYTFRVIACNNTGLWNEEGTSLAIAVSPFFWQTWWFRILLLGTFTIAVVGVVRFVSFRRLRAQLYQAEQQAALHQERTRIARDIHDDIGGSLAHIKLLSEIAIQDRANPDATEAQMRKITHTTQGVLKSLDEIVWAINPRNDTLPDLISYLGQHAVEFLRAAGIACLVDLPDNPQDIPVASAVRHHVLLVVKEALTNIVRHSGARTVRLQIATDGGQLRLTIADDGSGFAHAPDNALADGIRNMRQRISSIGGTFQLESKPGSGTTIAVALPISKPA